ncbi:unnamed protein product, partial [Ectocarpus sp. 13 AM-2016]
RYVGDILAWVHQAVAMEKELVATLFGGGGNDSDSGGEDGGALAPGDGAAGATAGEDEGLMSAEEVLCKVLQGIARPLQVGRVLRLVR